MIWLLPHPLSRQKAVSFLFPVFLHVCRRLSLLTGEGEEPNNTTASLVLYESFNTLCLSYIDEDNEVVSKDKLQKNL
jgi:hypothetical protein